MLKYIFFIAFALFYFEGYAQDKSVPEGFELVSLDGNDAYLNLETGEIKLVNAGDKPSATVENEISNTILETTAYNNTHIVAKGETLYSIARKYNITVEDIYRLNNKSDASIYIGQEIIINQTKTSINKVNITNVDIHIVEKGESLYKLSKKYNVSIPILKELNQLSSNTILIGQRIRLK